MKTNLHTMKSLLFLVGQGFCTLIIRQVKVLLYVHMANVRVEHFDTHRDVAHDFFVHLI